MLILIGAGLLVCAYTWLGYPALIGLLSRLRSSGVETKGEWSPSITACVAVHNGAAHIEAKLGSLLSQDYPPDLVEVLVYADGCTDDTVTLVAKVAARDPRVKLVEGTKRAGKPTALNHMRRIAKGEVLVMTDVRQPLSRNSFRSLVCALGPETVGCVSGNLVLVGLTGASFYWKYENWIRSKEARFRSMVGVTGPLYAVRRADLPELPSDTILDDMWIPMRLRLSGKRLLFAPDAEARDDAFDDEREFSRKARTLAGNYQLFARLPRLLIPGLNPSWFETFSHKILRLICPWVLVALPVLTAMELASLDPPAWLSWFAAIQVLFLIAAIAGPRAGRATALARSFVVLNAAAIVGLWRFLSGRQRITW